MFFKKIWLIYIFGPYKYTNFSFYSLKKFPSTFSPYKIFNRNFWSTIFKIIFVFFNEIVQKCVEYCKKPHKKIRIF